MLLVVGANVVTIGSTSGNISCTGLITTAGSQSLTGCTGGTGSYSAGTRISLVGQQLATVTVSLQLQSVKKPYRQFTVGDTIELRNSKS